MKKNYIHVTFLLDRSGSMHSIRKDTIGGFNSFIEDQQKEEGECTFTMIQFAHNYEVLYDFEKVKEIPLLSEGTYRPKGSTALLDALGKSISQTGMKLADMDEKERPEKVLFIILTDGQENSSVEYTRSAVMGKIKHQEEKYNWKFMYLGANQDAIEESAKYGISSVNTMTFVPNTKGVDATYNTLCNSVSNLRSVDVAAYASMDAISDEDREKQKEAMQSE